MSMAATLEALRADLRGPLVGPQDTDSRVRLDRTGETLERAIELEGRFERTALWHAFIGDWARALCDVDRAKEAYAAALDDFEQSGGRRASSQENVDAVRRDLDELSRNVADCPTG